MRAVPDTNGYISALNFGGAAEDGLGLGRAGTVQFFISPSILGEIEGVLFRKFHWSGKKARETIVAIREFVQLVHPKETLHVIVEDEADNRILECAVGASADFVITGDKHLRQLTTFRGIAIVSPRECLWGLRVR